MWKSPPLFPGPSPPGRRPAGAWKAAAPLPSTRHPPTPLGKRCAFPTGPPAPRRRGKRGWRETRTEGLHLRLNPGWGGSLPDRCPGSLSGRCHHTDLASLYRSVPSGCIPYLPQLTYILIDENRLSPEELALAENRVAALFRVETLKPESLLDLRAELARLLPRKEEDPELRHTSTAGSSGCSGDCCPGLQFPMTTSRRCPCWKRP